MSILSWLRKKGRDRIRQSGKIRSLKPPERIRFELEDLKTAPSADVEKKLQHQIEQWTVPQTHYIRGSLQHVYEILLAEYTTHNQRQIDRGGGGCWFSVSNPWIEGTYTDDKNLVWFDFGSGYYVGRFGINDFGLVIREKAEDNPPLPELEELSKAIQELECGEAEAVQRELDGVTRQWSVPNSHCLRGTLDQIHQALVDDIATHEEQGEKWFFIAHPMQSKTTMSVQKGKGLHYVGRYGDDDFGLVIHQKYYDFDLPKIPPQQETPASVDDASTHEPWKKYSEYVSLPDGVPDTEQRTNMRFQFMFSGSAEADRIISDLPGNLRDALPSPQQEGFAPPGADADVEGKYTVWYEGVTLTVGEGKELMNRVVEAGGGIYEAFLTPSGISAPGNASTAAKGIAAVAATSPKPPVTKERKPWSIRASTATNGSLPAVHLMGGSSGVGLKDRRASTHPTVRGVSQWTKTNRFTSRHSGRWTSMPSRSSNALTVRPPTKPQGTGTAPCAVSVASSSGAL
jgi:hypothetical protein